MFGPPTHRGPEAIRKAVEGQPGCARVHWGERLPVAGLYILSLSRGELCGAYAAVIAGVILKKMTPQ
jgi:hypothetical protein